MPWTIPDKGEGDNDLQSVLFQEYLDVLVAGINGTDCVVSGCAVTGGADMTPEVAKGAVISNGTLFAVAATTATIGTADSTNPRIDLVVINSSGSVATRAGTAAASPKPPARTANDVVLAAVYVPASDTTIATTQLTDMRVIRDRDITLKRTTTAVVNNTTAAEQTYATITLPSGLFLAGKVVRLRCGGSYLFNSGTPTWQVQLKYGGTTMFGDTTGVATADADRGVWGLDVLLVAQGNSDQEITGMFTASTVGAKTAAATGRGDIASTANLSTAIGGSAAVDSDAGNRDFVLTMTMNVSNASDEITCEGAVFELL